MKNKCRMRFHHLVLTVVTTIVFLSDFAVPYTYSHWKIHSSWKGSNSFTSVASSLPRTSPLASERVSPTRLFSSKDDDSNSNNKNDNRSEGPLGFLFNPYQSKIPKELEAEIYKAEANTAAAKDRNVRIGGYAVIAFIGILCAFFNGFITELRTTDVPDGFSLDDAGFGWVEANAVARFLFMNKIGGGIMLLTGAGAGLLAEAEYDTRRINAEKIFEELKRRKEAKEKKARGGGGATVGRSGKKKRRSGKEAKRMGALAEIVDTTTSNQQKQKEEQPKEHVSVAATDASEKHRVHDRPPQEKEIANKQGGGILDTVKDFYEKADTMAASQALLLNKKLEDAGMIDKITDETGFQVIGKDAASKLRNQKEEKPDEDIEKEKGTKQ